MKNLREKTRLQALVVRRKVRKSSQHEKNLTDSSAEDPNEIMEVAEKEHEGKQRNLREEKKSFAKSKVLRR